MHHCVGSDSESVVCQRAFVVSEFVEAAVVKKNVAVPSLAVAAVSGKLRIECPIEGTVHLC